LWQVEIAFAQVDNPGILSTPMQFKISGFGALTLKKHDRIMTKPHRKLKKANHGQRAANSKARKSKRRKVRT